MFKVTAAQALEEWQRMANRDEKIDGEGDIPFINLEGYLGTLWEPVEEYRDQLPVERI